MSASRRAASGDDNILARLEREAKRGPSAASWSNHARLAWCGLAALAIVGLIGVLASLAKENGAGHRATLIEAKAAPDLFANGGFAPLPGPDRPTTMSTVLVDPPIALPKLRSSDRDGVPPLVMLKQSPASAKTVAPAKAVAPVTKTVAQSSAKPGTQASSKAVTPSPAARSAPVKLAAKSTPAKPLAAPARSTLAAATPRQAAGTPSHPVVATAPARKKSASAAAPAKAEPAVDSDVALLSAIIMQSSRHAAERAQIEAAQCGAGKKCAQSETAAAPKATD